MGICIESRQQSLDFELPASESGRPLQGQLHSSSKSDSKQAGFVARRQKQRPGMAARPLFYSLFPDPYFLLYQIRIGISTYRYLYSASGSSGRIWPADCESLNSSRTSPSLLSAFKKSS